VIRKKLQEKENHNTPIPNNDTSHL